VQNNKKIYSGSVRADLFGGTLDLDPIGLILQDSFTLNLALSLKAKVIIEKNETEEVKIISKDYGTSLAMELGELKKKSCFKDVGPLGFLLALAAKAKPAYGITIEVSSGSPPGAGLGGSSSLGVVFFQGLLDFFGVRKSNDEIIKIVKNIEAVMLNSGPTGFQDYYPALFGGVLSLQMQDEGVKVEQLFTPELKDFFETHCLLVYSGQTRFSGINNWEVYKGFFDKNEKILAGFEELGKLSSQAYQVIKDKKYLELVSLLAKEGEVRRNLFPLILTDKMLELEKLLSGIATLKICGAGGGGCFLLVFKDPKNKGAALKHIESLEMKQLEFKIEEPLSAG